MSGGGYGGEGENKGVDLATGGPTSFWKDIRDGGGPGRSGPRFEGGGIISHIGNAFGGPGVVPFVAGDRENSRIPNQPGTSFGRDLINGGGIGYEGDNFEGLMIPSMIANLVTSPFRDNTSIGRMLTALDDDEAFLSQPIGLGDATMRDLKGFNPAQYQAKKQQYLMKNRDSYKASMNDDYY